MNKIGRREFLAGLVGGTLAGIPLGWHLREWVARRKISRSQEVHRTPLEEFELFGNPKVSGTQTGRHKLCQKAYEYQPLRTWHKGSQWDYVTDYHEQECRLLAALDEKSRRTY